MFIYATGDNRMRLKVATRKNQKGAALIFTLYTMVVFLSLGALFAARTIHEKNMTAVERQVTASTSAANGGVHAGLKELNTLINTYLNDTISNSNPNGVVSYTQGRVASGDGIGWLIYSVRNNNTPVLTQNTDQAEYGQNGTIGDATYQYTIVIMEKSDPATVNPDTWDFPFNFRIESLGSAGGTTTRMLVNGDFTVRVQKDNFAKYALFTNSQTLPNGTYVWFTNKTNFAGPLHTNARFNFALNPSGTFDGVVEQDEQLARFYNNGFPVSLDADYNGTRDVPTFNDEFHRDVDGIALTTPTQQQDMIDQAQGGQTFVNNGIYLANNGTSLTGGIYVVGDGTVSLSVDTDDNAVYTVTQASETRVITVDQGAQETRILNTGTGAVETYQGIPDGVDDVGTLVYVNGNITSLAGTVQEDTQLTIAGTNDIVVSNHLRYSTYTAAVGTPGTPGYVPPSAEETTNLLGLVSWGGNVRIGTSAPDDVNVHGTVLAKNGIFQVDNYNDTVRGPRGTATVLGGVITNNYGAFGLFNGGTGAQISGYGRNFAYDQRMQTGSAPPYFPTLDTFIAFTNDITDKLIWQEGGG